VNAARQLEESGHPQQTLVEPGVLPYESVVAVEVAVVAHEHDHRVVVQIELTQSGREPADVGTREEKRFL
jgi:hypothetical protein